MGAGTFAYLVLQGILFAVWAFLMFRALFGLMQRSIAAADQAGGGFLGWIVHSLRMFFGYFTDPTVARERRVLIILSVVLMLVTFGSVYIMKAAS